MDTLTWNYYEKKKKKRWRKMLYLAVRVCCRRKIECIDKERNKDGGYAVELVLGFRFFFRSPNLLYLNTPRDNERLKCNYGSGRLIALYFVPIEQE